jgi:glycerate 2-kinase
MKIVIAPDSFKESLSAREVADNVEAGICKVMPSAQIVKIPVADGGEGTVDALVSATGGRIVETESYDALMRPIRSFIGVLGDGKTAVIEMAAASGLALLSPAERNPLHTSSFGTGFLVRKAIELGFTHIVLGIGGSATNDGGMGLAKALGYRFLGENGRELVPCGGNLKKVHKIDSSKCLADLLKVKLTVACDVTNPLCGENGASIVFGPQKGATYEMVQELDAGLFHFAEVIKKQFSYDIANVAGAGAAGGVGAGLLAFTHAELKPGFEIVRHFTRLDEQIRDADLVFTAEGRIDFQTQFGKTPFGVAQIALAHKVPVIVLAGSIGQGAEELLKHGVTAYFAIADKPMELAESIQRADILLQNTAGHIMRIIGLARG